MSILLLAVFLLPIFTEECIDPLKVFATFSALSACPFYVLQHHQLLAVILLVVPFLICTTVGRIRQATVPPDEIPLPLPPSYSTNAPAFGGLHAEFKGPRTPPSVESYCDKYNGPPGIPGPATVSFARSTCKRVDQLTLSLGRTWMMFNFELEGKGREYHMAYFPRLPDGVDGLLPTRFEHVGVGLGLRR
ncbi:hypothetical protein C8R45DRAFT_1071789 [Mycena sanguinolenta]|nr:hypothetical protein C8R45DRAFT_1071789 [Mycena sanguinolenta]